MSAGPAQLRDVAVTVAREAADRLRAERPSGRVTATGTKSTPTDAVTAYDTAVQRLVRSRLDELRPGDGFLGEESVDGPGGPDGPAPLPGRSPAGVTWVVDPIDGTVNFMYGLPAYAVSVAAQVGGRSVAGCVVDVASGAEYAAARGLGASVREGQTGPQVLRVPEPVSLAQALVATGFAYDSATRQRQAAAVGKLLGEVRDIRRLGAASLDLCAVAAGRVDAYVEQGLHPWDLAAGALVAEEAGAAVVGHDAEGPGHRLVIACAPGLLADLRDLVGRCGF